jgi:hypothetical protein
MSNKEPRQRRPRPRTPPPFVMVKIHRDTYELLSRAQVYLGERRRGTVDLSDAIDELVAVSPFLLDVIGPGALTTA